MKNRRKKETTMPGGDTVSNPFGTSKKTRRSDGMETDAQIEELQGTAQQTSKRGREETPDDDLDKRYKQSETTPKTSEAGEIAAKMKESAWKMITHFTQTIAPAIRNMTTEAEANTPKQPLKDLIQKIGIVHKAAEPLLTKIKDDLTRLENLEEYIKDLENRLQAQLQGNTEETRRVEEIRRQIESAKTITTQEKIIKEKWPKAVYQRTAPATDSFLKPRRMRILIMNEKGEQDEGLLKALEYQYPRLKTFRNSATGNRMATIVRTENTREGAPAQPTDNILLAGKLKKEAKIADILKLIGDIEKHRHNWEINNPNSGPAEDDEENIPMIMFPTETDYNTAKKITELGIQSQRVYLSHKMTKREAKMEAAARRIETNDRKNTVIINPEEGQTSQEIMKNLKNAINPTNIGIDVETVTKTPNGDLKLRIREKVSGGKEKLVQEITSQLGNKLEIKPFQVTTKMILKDLEETATQDEIEQALKEIITGPTQRIIRVDPPRTSAGGKTTATYYVDKTDAMDLEKKGRIQVGWSRCKTERHIIVPSCQNCQCIGHSSRFCNLPPSREKLCHRCATSGHTASECESQVLRCYNCRMEGHPANSMTCPYYRERFYNQKSWIKQATGPKRPTTRTGTTRIAETQTDPIPEEENRYDA